MSEMSPPLIPPMSGNTLVASISPLNLAGTKEWAKKHDKDISTYFDWIKPQLTRPAVILPPK